jgi:SAM-dependent methyltransferase
MCEKDKSRKLDQPPMGAQDFSEIEDWSGYFNAVLGKGARDTLIAALDFFEQEGFNKGLAIDLAAGEGRDTLELLSRNWRVLATDNHPEAFTHLWARVTEDLKPQLTTIEVNFCDMTFPNCDMVNASFAIPFCEPQHFELLWNKIVASIRPGGRFAGQFFGNRDTWASIPNRSHHSREEVLKLLEGDDPPELRKPKHWQIFHIVAKKIIL